MNCYPSLAPQFVCAPKGTPPINWATHLLRDSQSPLKVQSPIKANPSTAPPTPSANGSAQGHTRTASELLWEPGHEDKATLLLQPGSTTMQTLS